MDKMIFSDAFKFVPTERMYTEEGYLVAPAKIARPGIQLYRGSDLSSHPEFPKEKFTDESVIRLYRPAEEVFNMASVNSFKNVPITDEHPPELLNAKTVRKYQRGIVLADVAVDEEFGCLQATIKVTDEEAVQSVKCGKVEMSAGYRANIFFEPGVTEDGQEYDAVQRGIEGNHVAIVPRGRAGAQMRIADGYSCAMPTMDEMPDMTIVYDGCDYKAKKDSMVYARIGQMLIDSEAEFIREAKVEKDELRGELEDEDYKDVNAGHTTKNEPVENDSTGGGASEEVTKYKEGLMDAEEKLAELQAKYDALEKDNVELTAAVDVAKTALQDAESKIPTMDQIDELVSERQDVVGKCRAIVEDLDVSGKSNLEIKKEVVLNKMPHLDADTLSDAYVEAAFDLIEMPKLEEKVEPTNTPSGRSLMDKAMADAVIKPKTERVDPREAYAKRNREMWKK